MCNDLKLNKDEFIVRKRYLPEKENFGIALSNRAGMMEETEYKKY